MIPSEEKVRAMAHRAVKAIEKDPAIKVPDPNAALVAIKKGVGDGVKVLESIHDTARRKIESLSRNVEPGTRDWDELFAKYVGEEFMRRGF